MPRSALSPLYLNVNRRKRTRHRKLGHSLISFQDVGGTLLSELAVFQERTSHDNQPVSYAASRLVKA